MCYRIRCFCALGVFFLSSCGVRAVDWDSAAKVSLGVGAVACGMALVYEGLSHMQHYYQQSRVASLNELVSELRRRYDFLLQSHCADASDVADLLVCNVRSVEDFLAKFEQDFVRLVDMCTHVEQLLVLPCDQDSNSVFLEAADAVDDAHKFLLQLESWKFYFERQRAFILLFHYLSTVALPLYNVYERYPVIAYAKALARDREQLLDLYRSFCSENLYEGGGYATLVDQYERRIRFLNTEISRVVESYAYQVEKESSARDQREKSMIEREASLDCALLLQRARVLQSDVDASVL